MCFSGEMSGGFSMIGLFMSIWIYTKTDNLQLAIGVFYFFLMEFLQYFQYLFIDDCENKTNQVLTLAGYLHICYQPYFTHIINSALTKSPKILQMYVPILRLCLVGGTMLFLRYFLAGQADEHFPGPHEIDLETGQSTTDVKVSTEWLRGETLCTVSGKYHLAWVVPMSDVSYYIPLAAIHSFLMFAPFFVIRKNMMIQGVVLWATGPALAAYITPNLMEQASIWCFFSIAQIGVMLFLIRNVLISNWGASGVNTSEKKDKTDPHLTYLFGWPMDVKVDQVAKGK
jgi:hypothetical protein